MQIEVKLQCADDRMLSFDYLYGLFSAIMNALSATHSGLAREIHDGVHRNRAKLICLSPFNGGHAVVVAGTERKQLQLGRRTWFRIASPIPEFLNAVGESLLRQGRLLVMGKEFKIQTINMVAPPVFSNEMVWRPFGSSASIVTAWTPKSGKKRFIRPGDHVNDEPPVEDILRNNLLTKFNKRLRTIRSDIADSWLSENGLIGVAPDTTAIGFELIPVEDGMPYKNVSTKNKGTVIYSWRCPVKVKAPVPLQRTVWSCGLGSMNFQGFGLMQEGKNVNQLHGPVGPERPVRSRAGS